MDNYTADFETGNKNDAVIWGKYTNSPGPRNRVYLWCLCRVLTREGKSNQWNDSFIPSEVISNRNYWLNKIKWGTDIRTFFKEIFDLKKNIKIYFHNLKFDGQFILWYLLENGYKYVSNPKVKNGYPILNNNEITHNQIRSTFYSIYIQHNKQLIAIKDSAKLYSSSVANLYQNFKGIWKYVDAKPDLDVKLIRANKWILNKFDCTRDELYRCCCDTVIMSLILGLSEKRFKRDTRAGHAFFSLIKIEAPRFSDARKWFRMKYPLLGKDLTEHNIISRALKDSYRGGFVYLNPLYKNKLLENVYVYDCNSMYPTMMRYRCFPFGPVLSELPDSGVLLNLNDTEILDSYAIDDNVYTYIVEFYATFSIKPNKIAFIQENNVRYGRAVYLSESGPDFQQLTLCQPDFELFLENYNVNYSIVKIYYFRCQANSFTRFIDMNYKIKQESPKDSVDREIAKLTLNSAYGRFAQSSTTVKKIPHMTDNGFSFSDGKAEESEVLDYAPVAIFTSAYARRYLIKNIQSFGKDFVYCDTDSIHTLSSRHRGLKGIVEDETTAKKDLGKLGYWKLEHIYKLAKYLHQKCYYGIYEINGHNIHDIVIAGYNGNGSKNKREAEVKGIEYFSPLSIYHDNLKQYSCIGGCYLDVSDFVIREI